MEENKQHVNEDIFSKVLRAGRRTYFFDVRSTKAGDYYLTISESKTDDDYVKEAYDAIKDDITVWQNSKKNIGKTFNPDTGKIE